MIERTVLDEDVFELDKMRRLEGNIYKTNPIIKNIC